MNDMISSSVFENKVSYLSEINKSKLSVYWLVLLFIMAGMASLPFVEVDISVRSQGIIRPRDEKAELKSSVSTIIDTVFFKEGDNVIKGDVVIKLRMENIAIKRSMNEYEIMQRSVYIADLNVLTKELLFTSDIMGSIQSPVYKQQVSRFIFQLSEMKAQLRKVQKELYMDSVLSVDKIIAPKEMFDKQIEHQKLIASIMAAKQQQLAVWEEELAKYRYEMSQYQNAIHQLHEDSVFYLIKAPVSGVLQGFNKFYSGSMIQAGDVLAIVSPDAELIAECYINPADIGLLAKNQHTLLQVDAFDYKYFGIVTGRIDLIGNDYVVNNNRPVFKVLCGLDDKQLHLKNGFSGNLKKGMTVQARFVIARRSLWQLLFDKVNDWINPAAPEKTN